MDNTHNSQPATVPNQAIGSTNTGAKNAKTNLAWKIFTILFAAIAVGLCIFVVTQQLGLSDKVAEDPSGGTTTGDGSNANNISSSDDYLVQRDEIIEILADIDGVLQSHIGGYKTISTYNDYSLSYQIEGAKTEVALKDSYGIFFSLNAGWPQSTQEQMKAKLGSEALKNDVTTKMRTLGFGAPTEAMWGNLNYLHREKNIFCVYTPDLIGEFRFSCSNLLWGSEDNLELLNSLAEAAKSKTGEYPSYISASLSNIKNSVNAPYQTITVSGASYGMLFYRVNPTAEWVYVTSGQDTPSCDVFKGDAAKAFEGLGCANYDTNKILTVKP